ncbi:MAG TPA: ABC transporter ATP-binding protein, partial [Chloroflexota bacterium]|nr:ABC transporter ATP-binding protein [Chloroflexota bacterium]
MADVFFSARVPPPGAPPEEPPLSPPARVRQWARGVMRETARIFANTPRVVALVWRASPARVSVLCALTLAQGLLPTATVWLNKLVVDQVVAAVTSGGDPAALQRIFWLVAFQFLLGAAGIGLNHVSGFVQQALSDLVSHDLSVRVFAKANTLDLSYFETPEFYDRLRNAQRLGSQPVQLVTGGLLGLVRQTITFATMVTLLFRFHPLLPLAIVLAAIPNLVTQMYYGRFGWRLQHRLAPLYRKQSYFGGVMTSDQQAKEIRVFGLGDHLLGRYVDAALETIRQQWVFRAGQRRATTLLTLLSAVISSGAYLFAVLEAAAGRITLGDLTLYTGAVAQAQGALGQMLGGVTGIYETNLQVDDLFMFLDFEPKVRSAPGAPHVPRPIRHGIEFRDVSFSYPFSDPNAGSSAGDLIQTPYGVMRLPPVRRGPWDRRGRDGEGTRRRGPAQVLRGVSFTLQAGKTLALVGANGAGKTTLVKLLARLYDPTGGQILLDGTDLRNYDVDDLRRQVAVVFQDYARFQLPARDNIGFGQLEHLGDHERVVLAARQGGAEPVVE